MNGIKYDGTFYRVFNDGALSNLADALLLRLGDAGPLQLHLADSQGTLLILLIGESTPVELHIDKSEKASDERNHLVQGSEVYWIKAIMVNGGAADLLQNRAYGLG